MPRMKWLKARFQYNGRPSVLGEEVDVETRFVPLLLQMKVAELLEAPQRRPPAPSVPVVADQPTSVVVSPNQGMVVGESTGTPVSAMVMTTATASPSIQPVVPMEAAVAPVSNPVETAPVASDPGVIAAASAEVEDEKDISAYNTRDMTTTKRGYKRRSVVDDASQKV